MYNVHDPPVLYIKERLVPNPDQAKDWITHELYWRRMGEFTTFFFLAFLVSGPPDVSGTRNRWVFDVENATRPTVSVVVNVQLLRICHAYYPALSRMYE